MQSTITDLKWQRRAVIAGRILLIMIALACVVVIAGWLLQNPDFKRIGIASTSAIPSSTALALLIFCIINLDQSDKTKPLHVVLGIFLAAIGLVTLTESIMCADWELAFPIGPQPDSSAGITFPAPMAPNISVKLLLLGIATAIPEKLIKRKALGQTCAFIVLLAALSAIMGHSLGIEFMCTMVGCIKLPVVSSAMFGIAAIGFMLVHPRVGGMNLLCTDNAGGALARKLSGVLLVVPIALGMRALAVNSGIIDQNFGWFLFGGTMLALMWQTIGISARNLAKVDEQKSEVEQKLQNSSAALARLSSASANYQLPKMKKVCLTCAKSYDESELLCPDDGDTLVAVTDDNLVGRTFAERYKITHYLGKGGMCAVYKAQHVYTDKIFAIKVLLRHLASDPSALKRFQREAKAATMLSHPNLLEVYDFGVTTDGQAFIVMEYVEGKSLDDLLQEIETCEISEFIEICTQICDGLLHAHENGVVHRDLKPSNVMLRDKNGQRLVQIVDFGLAKVVDEQSNSRITQTSQVVGSPVYLSPEQYSDYEFGPHVDVYSLGCMMYELLTGAPPFIGESITEIVQKHLNEPPPPLADELGLPPDLRDAIMRTIDKDPKARPTVEELLEKFKAHQIALA